MSASLDISSLVRRNFSPPRIVSIAEFAESSEFAGKPLYPLQRVLLKLIFLEEMTGEEEDYLTWMISGGRGDIFLSPNIRERRDYCREHDYPHFTEIDLVGGRRAGKGHITALAVAKKIYDVQQIPDPGAYFNIDIDKEIYFAAIAPSLKVAKERQFADYYSTITRCKPLAERIPPGKALAESISIRTDADDENIRRMKQMGLKVNRDFSKLQIQPMAANAATVRGLAMASCCLDEMAHMMEGESRSSASEMYKALEPSFKQFRQNILLFCNSSPYTKVGQFYEQALLAQRAMDDAQEWFPMRFALQWASWALYDFWWREQKFRQSIVVSPTWMDQLDPQDDRSILSDSDKEARKMEQLSEKANPESYRVEIRSQWAEVVDAYLNPHRVDQALSGLLPNGEFCKQTAGGGYLYTYMGHCDPSSTTAGFGFAIGHVEEFEDYGGIFSSGTVRHVVFDRVMRWNPDDFGGTINYTKVREELEYWLKVYRPKELTFDQYNSVHIIQELRDYIGRSNLSEVRIGKVDATAQLNWERWEVFKTALNLGMIHIPPDCIDPMTGFNHSQWVSDELKFLQEKPAGKVKRIDKQDFGPVTTKDIADCVCEITHKFLSSYLGDFTMSNLGQQLQSGSERGYRIGGNQLGGPMGQENSGMAQIEQFYGSRNSNNPARARGIVRNGSGRRR